MSPLVTFLSSNLELKMVDTRQKGEQPLQLPRLVPIWTILNLTALALIHSGNLGLK